MTGLLFHRALTFIVTRDKNGDKVWDRLVQMIGLVDIGLCEGFLGASPQLVLQCAMVITMGYIAGKIFE